MPTKLNTKVVHGKVEADSPMPSEMATSPHVERIPAVDVVEWTRTADLIAAGSWVHHHSCTAAAHGGLAMCLAWTTPNILIHTMILIRVPDLIIMAHHTTVQGLITEDHQAIIVAAVVASVVVTHLVAATAHPRASTLGIS